MDKKLAIGSDGSGPGIPTSESEGDRPGRSSRQDEAREGGNRRCGRRLTGAVQPSFRSLSV
jgi:hypothetical protein